MLRMRWRSTEDGRGHGGLNSLYRLMPSSVIHFGKPFDEDDVRGVCGIDESTKDLTSIGRFGIGFKSVYAFTDSPEIHSGSEHFAIDSFVWPRAVAGDGLPPEQTVIRLPFRSNDSTATTQILAGLQRLGPRTLLFLREIDEISWTNGEGTSGMYLRGKPRTLSNGARQVLVIGQDKNNGRRRRRTVAHLLPTGLQQRG